jgi:hypothetical protein
VHREWLVKRTIVQWVGYFAVFVIAAGCGGDSAELMFPDGSADASNSGADVGSQGGDAAVDATAPPQEATPEASDDSGDAAAPDAGAPSCAPPADATKAALCIVVAPEAIAFVAADPSFDGKGLLAVDVHDTADPDGPDGGSLPALQGATFPSIDGGGPEIDLSSTLPALRFDGLPPGVVYPRVVFVDSRDTQNVGAGWWLGGYDLSRGLEKPTLLRPVSLVAGEGTVVTIDLTALRALGVTLTRSAAPIGNGQGPAIVVVTPDSTPSDASALFGAATSPCANLAMADASAVANGFVFGSGPYYAVGVLDDFDEDASVSLPPGALSSLSLVDGAVTAPPSTLLQYGPRDYVVQKTIDLDLAVPAPDAGADPVSCP